MNNNSYLTYILKGMKKWVLKLLLKIKGEEKKQYIKIALKNFLKTLKKSILFFQFPTF